jgi:hypothetical protein
MTQWTGSATNQVFDDDIEGAGRLFTHLNVKGVNLIFTSEQVYTMRYIGLSAGVWEIKLLDNIGIISALARVVANGIGFWMGNGNFYMWRGGNVEIMPSNTEDKSSIHDYVFGDINLSQKSKFHAWYNERFQEVWFHYCSAVSNEPDRVARVSLKDYTWTYEENFDRCASQYKNYNFYPLLFSSAKSLYQHEKGQNDGSSAMSFSLTSPKVTAGKDWSMLSKVVPDSTQTGTVTVAINTYLYPQSSSAIFSGSFSVTPTTEKIDITVGGRLWSYSISGSTSNQVWKMGQWWEEVQNAGGAG